MEILKNIDKARDSVKYKISKAVENLFFESPESVGTIRLHFVYPDEEFSSRKEKALMNMGYESWGESSPYVKYLPTGIFKNQQIVEVMVRKSKIGISSGVLVAIRPFEKGQYGKFFGPEDYINDIFTFNLKTPETCPKFFEKFLKV